MNDRLIEPLRQLIEPPAVYYLIGVIFVAILLLVAISRFRASRRGITPFKSEGGRIEISQETIRRLIEHTVEGVSGVENVRCKMYQGRRLTINLALNAHAPIRLQEMDTEIKRRVRSSLKTQFGLENVDSINIKVTKVIGETNLPPVEDKHVVVRPAEPVGYPEPKTEPETRFEREGSFEPLPPEDRVEGGASPEKRD